MIARLVAWSTRHHWLVLGLALILASLGELGRRRLSKDVVPDLSDPQIAIVVDWMGHPATEVARAVTRVLTVALDGVPGASAIRGSSMAGMAYVDVVFRSSSELTAGRREIAQRLATVHLPQSTRLSLGPEASATGWVFQYALVDPLKHSSLLELRRFQDDVLRPALGALPGVAEVASAGGAVQDVSVELQPDKLRAQNLAYTDVLAAVQRALASNDASLDSLRAESLPGGTDGSARVSDVALVHLADGMPSGVVDLNGTPAVGGIVVARRDASLESLVGSVRATLERERKRLPAGVELVTVYDRLELAKRVDSTLLRALGEEIGVVVLVILIFLLHLRSALIPLTTLPVVLLFTFGAMWLLGVPATIMSLGGIGIALGMAVDADVVALEACHRELEGTPDAATRNARLVRAASSFAPAILTSLVIAALSFLPVFTFGGETGRLLDPLALGKTLVVGAAALVALTLAPALRARLLTGRVRAEFDNPITRRLVAAYRPFVQLALSRPRLTLITAALLVLSCLPVARRLGGEFFPRVDEGDLLFMPTTLPGVPAEQAAAQLRVQDLAISKFKEVSSVFGKVGRADTATDPAPFSMAETTVRLRPRAEWPLHAEPRFYSSWAPEWAKRALRPLWPDARALTHDELVDALDHATRLPGWTNAWTAPARARLDMMSTGVRTPVGVRLIAADPARLDALGTSVKALLTRVPGTRSAVLESSGGQARLAFSADPELLMLRGVDAAQVSAAAASFIDGGQIGSMTVAGRSLRVRLAPDVAQTMRSPDDQLREISVRAGAAGGGAALPLALLGHPSYERVPAGVRAERGELVGYIYVDLDDGTNLLGYVERASDELARAQSSHELALSPGERYEWTGQYQLLSAGQRRLKWIVPMVALAMLGLLVLQFRSLTEAVIVLSAVPFALVGSLWTLYWLGYPLSAPVWVGLLSTVGLAMQTGVVMVVYIDDAFHRRLQEGRIRTREDIVEAHAAGTILRLRPKLMTIATMAAGLLPLLWAEGAGAEIMKRVAAPMIGGLLTSALLTLEVLPVLYTVWRTNQLKRAAKSGEQIEAVVGVAPAWARR